LASLVYSLSEVGVTGRFSSVPVLVSFVLGMALMLGFVVHALRARHPLLNLRLFKNRTFAVSNICMLVMGGTLFGSMFLLPLYYQIARGQSPWQAGLLMAPQGVGAALLMRKSGVITDRAGPRRVVPAGVVIMTLATVPFAFVSTNTSEVLLAGTLFIRGLGLGLCVMPIMSSAFFDLSHAEVPGASTTLNIVRQIGASVATALFAVVLQRQIVERTHARSGSDGALLSQTAKLPPAIADKVAQAFAHTFWWAVATILLAFVPTLFLPSHGAGNAGVRTGAAPAEQEDGDQVVSASPVVGVMD
jgi:nitrate/nitrite transporter NarK